MASEEFGGAFIKALADPDITMAYGRLNVSRAEFFEHALMITYRATEDQSDLPAASGSCAKSKIASHVYCAQLGNDRIKDLRSWFETDLGTRLGGGDTTRNSLINEPVITLDDRDDTRTDILHEYFVSPDRFPDFLALCRAVIPTSYQEFLNVTLRFINTDSESWLSYATVPRIAAVMSFSQEMTTRAEARTLLTYPEWHIVHAYDDYARVIGAGDPHDFGYFRAIRTYWTSLCALKKQAAAHGGVDRQTKEPVNVIGISFTAELALKSVYAGVIETAVASTGTDALTLRMIVTGPDLGFLQGQKGVTVIGTTEQGIQIETTRYRALTELMSELASRDVDVVEIAGNDDIMLTVISDAPTMEGALFSFARQGYGDYRHLLLVKVPELMGNLRAIAAGSAQLEHVHGS